MLQYITQNPFLMLITNFDFNLNIFDEGLVQVKFVSKLSYFPWIKSEENLYNTIFYLFKTRSFKHVDFMGIRAIIKMNSIKILNLVVRPTEYHNFINDAISLSSYKLLRYIFLNGNISNISNITSFYCDLRCVEKNIKIFKLLYSYLYYFINFRTELMNIFSIDRKYIAFIKINGIYNSFFNLYRQSLYITRETNITVLKLLINYYDISPSVFYFNTLENDNDVKLFKIIHDVLDDTFKSSSTSWIIKYKSIMKLYTAHGKIKLT